jgi:peptidoglycan hydrolase FlgJ
MDAPASSSSSSSSAFAPQLAAKMAKVATPNGPFGQILAAATAAAPTAAASTSSSAPPSYSAFAPKLADKMTKVAPITGRFGPTTTAAQARAALLTPEQRAAMKTKIGDTAKDFEAQFIASMMSQSYEHVDLGGGQGADAFKSILMQQIGKKIAAGKGIGMAHQVETEMLKLQGLS